MIKWAVILSRCSKNSESFIKNFLIIFAIENWSALHKLSKKAADRPHIDTKEVVFASENDFRSSVPEGYNTIALPPLKKWGLLGKTEIGKFEAAIGRDQDVFRLDVSMDHTIMMHVLKPNYTTSNKKFSLLLGEFLAFIMMIAQVTASY